MHGIIRMFYGWLLAGAVGFAIYREITLPGEWKRFARWGNLGMICLLVASILGEGPDDGGGMQRVFFWALLVLSIGLTGVDVVVSRRVLAEVKAATPPDATVSPEDLARRQRMLRGMGAIVAAGGVGLWLWMPAALVAQLNAVIMLAMAWLLWRQAATLPDRLPMAAHER